MTLINFDLRAVAATGRVPVDARIRWQPVERRVDGGVVILPEARSVTLVGGTASADLDPGYYLFQEVTGSGMSAIRLVPAVGPVSYAALAAVDPATLAPNAQPEAAWLAMARATVTGGAVAGDNLILSRTDGTTVNAGNVRGPAGPADDATIAALAATPGTALNKALSATYARPLSNTFVMAGDSITEKPYHEGRSYWSHAVNFLNRRMNVIYNAGIGGNTSTQLLARFDTDVIAKGSDWVHILIGRNDLADTTDGGYTTVTTNIAAMLDKCKNAGKRVVLGTVIPSTGLTANQNNGRDKINVWIRNQALTRAVLIVDYSAAVTNPADGLPFANALFDGTHPGVGCAAVMGRTLANALSPFLAPTSLLLNSEADPQQLLLTGRFSGGGSGSVPTNWFESAPVGGARTYSKVARTDGINGSWQRLVIPAGGSLILAQNVNIGAALAVGQKCNFRFEYRATGAEAVASGQYLFASIAAYNGSTFTTEVFDCQYGAGTENVLGFDRSGVFQTADLTIPAGTTLVQARIQISAGITLDLDRASVQIAP